MGDERFGDLLRHVNHGLRSRLDARLRELGLTAAQATVLLSLGRSPRVSSAQLARACRVAPQSMNEIVCSLERAGLLWREPHDAHPRALGVMLTDPGRARLAAARHAVALAESEMVAGILQRDRKIFGACLERCAANLEAADWE